MPGLKFRSAEDLNLVPSTYTRCLTITYNSSSKKKLTLLSSVRICSHVKTHTEINHNPTLRKLLFVTEIVRENYNQ